MEGKDLYFSLETVTVETVKKSKMKQKKVRVQMNFPKNKWYMV